MPALNHADIALIFEAFEAMPACAELHDKLATILTEMHKATSKMSPEQTAEVDRLVGIKKRSNEAELRRKMEDVFLLRAKLVLMRRELDSEAAAQAFAASQDDSKKG